ncbi:RNA ligase RtcB family protein [Conchiformibius kuhniae]|uniref:3'-phosphate/5'-hydroxy nucleic acid ligase n=1 Tax=Conchiformibius kuhniae TaxID=211502 RepID=A0A8T9MQU6_9NEIS|nr:RNA ligase RtcB family protein [Conchiformibius kuhniae]UOP04280.1 RNA ligase RtcB family protein [Conchiformibius kuhniae]
MGNHYENTIIIQNQNTWIEGAAVVQLRHTATLNGMRRVAGMPDLQPGRGYPVGAAFFSTGVFYPALIGGDIGCGMGLWQTGLCARRTPPAKLVKQLGSIDAPEAGDVPATIGGGNHFAELQCPDQIYRAELLPPDWHGKHLLLLVHSGSRGLGGQILREHVERFGHQGLAENSPEAADYLAKHDHALDFARRNRAAIAARMLARWRSEGTCLLDLPHNFLQRAEYAGETGWLHRKGASPANRGLTVLPGSRGDYSYLLMPAENTGFALDSLAHGAGRKWQRGECKGRLSRKYPADSFRKTALGSVVVCADKALLYEEAPQAYKSVADTVAALEQAGLATAVARLKPVLTYKTAGACHD